MTIIELQEGEPKYLPSSSLNESLARAIYSSKKFGFEYPTPANNHQFTIVSPNLVGQVPVGKECLIRIAPKVPIHNLFLMLEVAYNLRSFQLLPGVVQLNSLQDIIERLASILAKRVNDRARKGLYRDYLNEHDDMPFVRGRIDIQRTSRSMMSGAATVHCHFQDHTADLVENQILLWTLQGISRLRIARAEVASQIRRACRALSGVVSLRHCSASECVNRFYHRLNSDYRPLHGICRFFLENIGPGIDKGEYEAIPFCVDMPMLFESFVAEWLKANAPVNSLVGTQYVSRLNANAELSFRIDIVLRQRETNRVIGILDTKYKGADTPEESDIQQVVAYALEMGTDKAFLVYPTSRIRPFQAKVGHVIVKSMSFDLSARLDQEGPRFLGEILERLQQPVR